MENEPMEAWLNEYTKPKTRTNNKSNFQKFLEWSGKTPKQLVEEFEQKQARHMILAFQKAMVDKGFSQNSVRNYVNSVRAFYASRCETIRGLKRKIVGIQSAKGEHRFSTQDLKMIREVGDFRDKAMISTACSLGWEASAFLDLDRDFVKALVERAQSQQEDFIAFDWQRAKTGAEQFGILTPIAINDLVNYIEATENEPTEKLFGMTPQGLNKWLKTITQKANVKTIGTVRFHLIRKWLMNTLSSAGLNAFQIKLIVGKKIPVTDKTYLQTIKDQALDMVKKAYPMHLSLVAYSNGNRKVDRLAEVVRLLFQTAKEEGLLRKVPAQHVKEMEIIIAKANGEEVEKEGSEDA